MSQSVVEKKPKIRIKMQSFDIRMLEVSLSKVVALLEKSEAGIVGPVPLPKKKKKYSLNRPTFVYSKSQEQFEKITYTRLIDITVVGKKTLEYLQNLTIPVGVFVDIKLFS